MDVRPISCTVARFASQPGRLIQRCSLLRFRTSLPLLAMLCLGAASAWALDPSRHLSQYAHTTWRTQSGDFGGTPIEMTQTSDGYLWVGTNTGLVRFDGVRFVPWTPPPGQRLPDARIFALSGSRDGGLWIGTAYNVSHLVNGELTNYERPRGRIEALLEDNDGAAWITRTQITDGQGPLCRIKGTNVRCFDKADGMPFPYSAFLAKDTVGNFWVGGFFGVCRWKPGSCATYFENKSLADRGIGAIQAIAAGADGSFWAVREMSGPGLRLEQFKDGIWTSHVYQEIAANNADVSALFVDRGNSLWIATANHGIYRIQGSSVDHFDRTDGLSSDAVGSFFEDREGTVWVVTSDGIDNFRNLQVATFSMREGMNADGASSLIAAHDGAVWVGNFEALNILRNNQLSAIGKDQGLPGHNVTTLLEDHAGRMWVGVDGGLWVYDHGIFRAILNANGGLLGIVFSIVEGADQSIWVRAGPNLYRIHDFTVQDETTSPQITKAYILAARPQGGVVLGLTTGDLLRYNNGQETTISPNDGIHVDQIRDIFVAPDDSIWGTTQQELFRWKDGRRENLTARNGFPCDRFYALLKVPGFLWISAKCGFVKIADSELENWWEHPDRRVKTTVVGPLEGVQPGLTSLKPQIARTSDGRLWFVNGRVLQMMDPDHPKRNLIPPPVHIEQVIADRETYGALDGLRLPALTRDLQIDYTALSFVAPEKVRYRYRLEPRDTYWQEPGIRRQAFYSDLAPGRYRFHVIACNNDGVWNETGATWSFAVQPAYYQTAWFRLMDVALAAFALWVLYRLRVRRMRQSMTARFDERIDERTRLAREFHDTLLQTIQASKMVADDALENTGDASYMQRALERVSGWLTQATQEGRAALNSLRTSTAEVNDLAEALERAARECSLKVSMEFALVVDGIAQQLHPIVRDEIYRIGYEAIRNACSHSGGSRLEIDLSYARNLVLRVRDDGKGIPPKVAGSGREGHFGLKGMQERALRVGGTLTLSSSAFSGTEVELIVPGNIVFTQKNSTRSNLLLKLSKFLGPRSRTFDRK